MYTHAHPLAYRVPPASGGPGGGPGVPHVGVHTIAEVGTVGFGLNEALESRKQCCASQQGLVDVRTRLLKDTPTRTSALRPDPITGRQAGGLKR